MTTAKNPAALIAAKFRLGSDGVRSYHPLICHLIDVAAVAEALWEECLARPVQEHLAESFQLDSVSTKRWVAFLAGVHDLGKATPVFQAKGSHNGKSTPPWLVNSDLKFPDLRVRDPGHGTVTAACLEKILQRKFGVSKESAGRLAVVTGGHHGIFPSAWSRRQARGGYLLGEPWNGENNPWPGVREELVVTLYDLLALEGSPQPPSNAASMLLAGFISVADWIGSDATLFPYAPDGPANRLAYLAYLANRRHLARQALAQLHWSTLPQQGNQPTFQQLFPEFSPRHLQTATEQLAPDIGAPGLAILEAPMGEGKTEAAFYLTDFWNAQGYRGSYVAMPSQATSNQLHKRFKMFLQGRYGAGEELNLQLLHGHASLNAEITRLEARHSVPEPSGIDHGDDEQDATVGAGEWFTYRKRGLLAPFGVGTVDQALLSVLQVKHGFVRLFGLAGKTVVLDEIHAYDTYMTTLLERLLEWLAALGAPTVLLSATLPSARRKALAHAYLRGLGDKGAPELPKETYPRITWTTGSGDLRALTVETTPEIRRCLDLQWLTFGVEDLPTHLLGQLQEGGCAAVICNTVNRAQDVYAALRDACAALPEEERPKLDLFHARYLNKDRQAREDQCLLRFGKPDQGDGTTANRPQRAVLVATQIIEQSLDLDFDVMVSEIAPVDLLLQRSGRLQRHSRGDHRALGGPVLQILAPVLDDDSLPKFERATTYVYDEHILLRTWYGLRGREAISVPEDIERLIEEIYRESDEPPADAPEPLAARWRETFAAMQVKRQHERDEAQQRRIPSPSPGARLEYHTRDSRAEDASDLHPALQALTRLTEASVEVVLLSADSPLLSAADSAPSLPTSIELVRHSVSITATDVVWNLLALPVPDPWKRSGLLRRMRLLLLDETHSCQLGNIFLRYDADLGLEIIR